MKCFVILIIIASFSDYSLQQGPNISQNTSQDTKNPAVTPRNTTSGCVCVPSNICNNTSRINTDSVGLIDTSIDEDEGECSSKKGFCCMPPEATLLPIEPKPVEHTASSCGYRNVDGVDLLPTSKAEGESNDGEFPWMLVVTSIEKKDGSNASINYYRCGGALIHPQAVLTAGHCVSDRSRTYHIRAGEWDTNRENELFPHQNRLVKSVEIHPHYYAGALLNDIAVLILDKPFQLAKHIDVICLPPQGEVVRARTRCFATGWGKNMFGRRGKYQFVLKRVELPVVQREKCQTSLRTTRLGAFFQLHKSFICAGGEPGIDTCKGDGGSPLVCPIRGHEERYQHIGIVAWGIGCGENNVPGVYANVALFRNWIDEQIKKHNLDTKSYNY